MLASSETDLIRNARSFGLMNKKIKDVDINLTHDIIKQLSILPLEYNRNIEYVKEKVNTLMLQYPQYYNLLFNSFLQNKIKYFKDDSYNYNKFPKNIRSNSILERYNKTVKIKLGEKRLCNWVIFLNFINDELNRIKKILGKNENINVLYNEKKTKFGKDKYEENNLKTINYTEEHKIEEEKKTIAKVWLKQKCNNCRYNAFFTIFYFTISSYLTTKKR